MSPQDKMIALINFIRFYPTKNRISKLLNNQIERYLGNNPMMEIGKGTIGELWEQILKEILKWLKVGSNGTDFMSHFGNLIECKAYMLQTCGRGYANVRIPENQLNNDFLIVCCQLSETIFHILIIDVVERKSKNGKFNFEYYDGYKNLDGIFVCTSLKDLENIILDLEI